MSLRFVAIPLLVSMLSVTTLSGCETTLREAGIKKEDIGLLTGAIGGAWIGSNVGKGKGRIVAIATGTLLGAALGKSVGGSLDKADLDYYNHVSQNTLETARTGSTIDWQNPDTGTHGSITPVKTYQQANTYCREYQQTIVVGGRTVEGYGTACRQPDGSWKIQQ